MYIFIKGLNFNMSSGKILEKVGNIYIYNYTLSKKNKSCFINVVKKRGSKRMPTPLEQLRNKTSENLIKRFDLDSTIPVDLNKIINHYGIILQPSDFKDLEMFPEIDKMIDEKGEILGAVVVQNDKLGIFYRDSDSVHRQQFTVAHELAHCCLNTDELMIDGHIEYRTDLISEDEKEKKANIFAGELLIPLSLLTMIYDRFNKPNLKILCKLFNVSQNVMRERLIHLNWDYVE